MLAPELEDQHECYVAQCVFLLHIMFCSCFITWIIWNSNEWLWMNSYQVHILKTLCMILHCLCFPEGDSDNNDQTSTCLCKLLSTHQLHNTTQHKMTQHNTTQHNTTFKIIFSVVGGLFCISKSKNDANYTIWRVGQAPDWWNLTECGLCQFLWGAWLCVYVERAELVFTQGEQRGARGASLQTDTLTC